MKRFLTSTTALSVALAFTPPLPVMAQTLLEDGKVVAADGTTVLCDPATGVVCDLATVQAQVQAEAEAAAAAIAEADAAAQAAADAAIAAQAQADADAAAAAAAQADADAAAAAQAQAEADAAAAAAVAAEADAAAAAQAQADADAAAAAQAQAEADAAAAQAQADADAAAAAATQADANAAAAAQVQAEADVAAAAQAEADAAAAAQADADAAIAAQAQAEADAAAAAQAETDAAVAAQAQADADAAAVAQAEADAAAALLAEQEAAARAAAAVAAGDAEAAALAQAEAEAAAAAAAAAQAAAVQAEADAAAAALAAADAQAAEAAAAATAQAEADAAAAALAATDAAAADAAAAAAAQAEAEAAALAAAQVPVEAPVVTETAVEGLTAALQEPVVTEGTTELAAPMAEAAAAAAPLPEGTQPSEVAPPTVSVVVNQTVTAADARSSSEEFSAAPVEVSGGKKSGLSNLEKVGLLALGALVVGAVINENNKNDRQEVVSNTGDRVVVQRPDGSYQIYKDDDAILRRPGSEVRTETYRDGSTRTIVEKNDGTQIVTVRDASGRVLRRATYDDRGRELVLFDDLQPERAIIISDLPRARPDRVTISTNDEDAALKARLAARQAQEIGRSFSLRQIREIAQVRDLAATINVDNITFDSGSSAIKATEAEKLADLGGLITDLIKANPAEVFLIEGHTDAVGSGASNLALSDRRAESVALALTEYFDVPPENIVVQGYGEGELRVDTQADERANRRVAVRIITPLMNVASR